MSTITDVRSTLTDVKTRFERTRFGRTLSEHWLSYAFVLPALVVLVLILWLPFSWGIWVSFHNWPIIGTPKWVGLEWYNYYLFEWNPFWTTVKVTILQTVMVIPQLVIAMIVTLALHQTATRLRTALNSLYLVPYIIPPLASGSMLMLFLDADYGPFFNYLVEFGFLKEVVYWSIDGTAALAIVLGATVWTFWPWVLLVFMASRAAIDDEYYEVARIYGASKWEAFRYITLPQMKGAIMVAGAIRTIYNLTNTAQVWQLTRGGPGFETTPLGLLLFRIAFNQGNMGRAFTAGLFLMIIGIILAIGFFYMFERSASETEELLQEHA